MSEAKAIGSAIRIPAPENMSEDMKRAFVVYHKIFDNMPAKKKTIVNKMFGGGGYTQIAMEAYEAVINKDYTDTQRIYQVGNWADMSLANLRSVMLLLEKNLEDTLKTIDETGAWLEAQGWHGLPSPVDQNGVRRKKTAHDIYNDMVRFSKTRLEYAKQTELQRESDEDQSSRRR